MKKILTTLTISLSFAANSYAANPVALVDISTAQDPSSIVAFVMDENGSHTVTSPAWERTDARHIVVKVPVSAKPSKYGAVVAMATSSSGTVSMSDVIDQSQFDEAALYSLPICEQKSRVNADPSQMGLLQSLVDVRTARRGFLQNKLKATLSGDFLDKLQRLEKAFGLTGTKTLDADLHPLELQDRLSRLASAIKQYRKMVPTTK